MSIDFKKVKLVKKETVEVSYSKTEEDGSITEVSESHKTVVHPDLKNAMQKLAPHLACLTEYVTVTKIKNKEEVENFFVTGYSIGGDEDDLGIVITGQRTLKNGKTITLNTPFTRFDEADESKYYFIDQVNQLVGEIEEEVSAYLDGKKAPDPQQELPFEENITSIVMDTPDPEAAENGNGDGTTKKNRRKKKEEAIHFPEE
jgi:hypothetical protein